MKIHELHLENYGHFRGERLAFQGGFQLIYGPNEAGKSTLLQAVRELLFRMPPDTAYGFGDAGGEVAAEAVIELRDARRVRFRRRKGRKGTVSGEITGSSEVVDEALLHRLLGAGEHLFEHVFGFSHKELRDGQKSLEDAKVDEALFGGGLGGLATLQQFQKEVAKQADDLYKERGRNPRINDLLKKIGEHSRELQTASLMPADFRKQREECRTLQLEADQLRTRREEIDREMAREERLHKAGEAWHRLQAIEAQLGNVIVPPGLPPHGAEEYRQTLSGYQESLAEIEQGELAAANRARDLERLVRSPAVLAQASEIEQRFQEVRQIEGFRRDLPLRAEESQQIKSEVALQLRQLHPEWDAARLEAFHPTTQQRTRMRRLAEQWDQLAQQRTKLTADRAAAEDQCRAARRRLEGLGTAEVPASLEAVVRRGGRYAADVDELTRLQHEQQKRQRAMARLEERLRRTIGREDLDWKSLPVPEAATIQRFVKRIEQAERRTQTIVERITERQQELQNLLDRINAVESQAPIPDRATLTRQRERRDHGWQLIRRRFMDQQPDTVAEQAWLGPNTLPLPEQLEKETALADRLADERQEKSEQVARREQDAFRAEQLREAVAEVQAQERASREDARKIEEEWRTLWEPCGIVPGSPAEMAAWEGLYRNLAELMAGAEDEDSRLRQLSQTLHDFETELERALPEAASSTETRRAATLLAFADQRLKELRKAATQREQSGALLADQLNQLERLAVVEAELTGQLTASQTQLEAALTELGFPIEWDAELALRTIADLERLRERRQQALDLDGRVRDMNAGLVRYQDDVASLCTATIPELSEQLAEKAVQELQTLLEAAKTAELEATALTRELAEGAQRLSQRRRQAERQAEKLRSLRSLAQVETDAEFFAVAERAARRRELMQQAENLQIEIRALRGGEDPDEFQRALAALDPALHTHPQDLLEQRQKIEADYQARLTRLGAVQDQLDARERENRTAPLTLALEGSRADLNAAVDQWATLMFAQGLLARAVKKFEREQQPQLLQEVGRLFSRMTAGRYVGVRKRLDESRTMVVEVQGGGERTPDQLSTGTREQLYLAIRLAYVQHYCRDSEPLPLVMDDVLVNFDDDRARSTLEVLLEVSQELQILFLTCHRRMVDLLHSLAPSQTPHLLPGADRGVSDRSPAGSLF